MVLPKEAREKLYFFKPDGKKRWKLMPMGALNSAPVFVAMILELQGRWNKLAVERGVTACGSKVIVDNVLVFGREKNNLLA